MEKLAIIDIGSNTVRVVIYEKKSSKVSTEVENIKVSLRLSQYIDDQNNMEAVGIQKLIAVLRSFDEIIQFHKVTEIDCTATAAIRNAANREEIIQRVNDETNFTLRVLSGEDEAYYGFLAVMKTLPIHDGIVVDVGGGSTEITLFKNRSLTHSVSVPFGVVSLRKQFSTGNSLSAEQQMKMKHYVRETLLQNNWILNSAPTIVGIGGSIRSISSYHQLKSNYPQIGLHGYLMNKNDFKLIYDELRHLPANQITGLSKDRVDLAIPALIVFTTLMEVIGATTLICCTKGLRDGIVFSKQSNASTFDIKTIQTEGIHQLLLSHPVELPSRYHLAETATQLMNQIAILRNIPFTTEQQFLVYQSGLLYYLGNELSPYFSSSNTFHLIKSLQLDGFLHKEKMFFSLTASFTNNSTLKKFVSEFANYFSTEEIEYIRLVGSVLKLCYSLNCTKRNAVSIVKVGQKAEGIHLTVSAKGESLVEKIQADKQKKHLEKVLNTPITIEFIATN